MVYVLLADGFEEIEAITPIDLLRRADIMVETVALGSRTVTGAHGIPVVADRLIDEVVVDDRIQAVLLPGGQPGTDNLEADERVKKLIEKAYENGIIIAAICAAPSILAKMGLLQDKSSAVYPDYAHFLSCPKEDGALWDPPFVSGKSAGHAIDFSLLLIEALRDKQTAFSVAQAIYYTHKTACG